MRYLTVTEVLEIHAEVLDGHPALRDRRLLESAVARPQASAFGRDAYPDIVSKAAGLLHSLVLNHPFLDGNKRTAVLAMLVFVDMNGYQLLAAAGEGAVLDATTGVGLFTALLALLHNLELQAALLADVDLTQFHVVTAHHSVLDLQHRPAAGH